MILGKTVFLKSVDDFRKRLKTALDDARYSYEVTKGSKKANKAGLNKIQWYKVGDRLWLHKNLFTDSYSKSQVFKKLGLMRYELFVITKLVGNNPVELELPVN